MEDKKNKVTMNKLLHRNDLLYLLLYCVPSSIEIISIRTDLGSEEFLLNKICCIFFFLMFLLDYIQLN